MKEGIKIRITKEKRFLRGDKYFVTVGVLGDDGILQEYEYYLPTKMELWKFIRKLKKEGKKLFK